MARIPIHTLILPILVYLLARQRTKHIKDTAPQDEYDYIIVGGGAAGSVLANRLSQDANVKVLLVEAGKKDNVTTEVPSLAIMLQETEYDWMYRTTQQEHACQSTADKKCPLPAGKVIGGSTSISFMNEYRGSSEGFAEMAKVGDEWSFDNLLPYFRKFEDDRTNGDCQENEFHGCGGEVTYTIGTSLPKTSEAFVESLKGNGFQETDLQTGSHKGKNFAKTISSIRNGIKITSSNAFLKPVQKRPNLHISLNTFVTKVLIDPDTKEATGVELERKGEQEPRQVKATREVILSAGTFRSPQLLTLSGIGPKEDLERLKIPIIAESPGVGQNLYDFTSSLVMIEAQRALNKEELELLGRSSITEWAKGQGPMSVPAGVDIAVVAASSYAENNVPDLHISFQSLPLLSVGSYFFKVMSGLNDEIWNEVIEPMVDKPTAFIHITHVAPKSRGYVKVVSADPHDHPEIDPMYYSVESDANSLVEGLDLMVNLTTHDAFKELTYRAVKLNFSQCEQHQPLSTAFHKCILPHISFSKWQYGGTNRMGADSDPNAVVDRRLRVKGVKKLRVVDGSVLPCSTMGTQQSVIYAIAEKAADLIKEDN